MTPHEFDRFIVPLDELGVVHPDIPKLQNVPVDLFQRPTGQEHFDQMTKAEQDEALGHEIAEAVRKGELKLSDLVTRNDGDLITQASPKELGIDTEDKT